MENGNINKRIPLPLSMVMGWLLGDDRLDDECWNSEVRYSCGTMNGWVVCLFGLFSLFSFAFLCWSWVIRYLCLFSLSTQVIPPPNSPALVPTTLVLSHLSHPQPSTSTSSSPSSHPQKGRSKQNSRLGEPSAWMRGRDEGVMWVFFF